MIDLHNIDFHNGTLKTSRFIKKDPRSETRRGGLQTGDMVHCDICKEPFMPSGFRWLSWEVVCISGITLYI